MRKTINIDGVELSYLEKNEAAKEAIFFIHGNSGSSTSWENQLNSNLFDGYRLIAIDLPGHGKSSRGSDPSNDYSPFSTAKILSSVVKHLLLDLPFALVGFSYGTNLIAEMLRYNINPIGIILISSCVTGENYGLEKIFLSRSSPSILFYNEFNYETISNYFQESLSAPNNEEIRKLTDDYLAVAADFKPSLLKNVSDGKISDEILTLTRLNFPLFVVFGQDDNLLNINYLDVAKFRMWNNCIYKIPHSGHWVHIDNAAAFNQSAAEYISERFKQSNPCL